jgi:hypothetical protein
MEILTGLRLWTLPCTSTASPWRTQRDRQINATCPH